MTWIDRFNELTNQKKILTSFLVYGGSEPEKNIKIIEEVGKICIELDKIEVMSMSDAMKKIKTTTINIESKWD